MSANNQYYTLALFILREKIKLYTTPRVMSANNQYYTLVFFILHEEIKLT